MGHCYVNGSETVRVLDLFSGLGGFSEAFVRSGDEVLRVENNPLLSEVPYTTMQDVHEMRERLALYYAQGEPIREYDVLLRDRHAENFLLLIHLLDPSHIETVRTTNHRWNFSRLPST